MKLRLCLANDGGRLTLFFVQDFSGPCLHLLVDHITLLELVAQMFIAFSVSNNLGHNSLTPSSSDGAV